MKLTRKGKIVFGTFFTGVFVLVQGLVGIPQASSPTQAEAQVVEQKSQKDILAKYVNADELTDTQLIELLQAVGFKGQDLKEAWAIRRKNHMVVLYLTTVIVRQETTPMVYSKSLVHWEMQEGLSSIWLQMLNCSTLW